MQDWPFVEVVALCPDPVIGLARSGRILIFNPAAERLLGYRADVVIDKLSIVNIYGSLQRAREIKQHLYRTDRGPCGQVEGLEVTVFDCIDAPNQ